MQRAFLLGLVLVVVVVGLVYRAASEELDPRDGPTACGETQKEPRELGIELTQQLVLCLLNRERAKESLPPLRENAQLENAALAHTRDMIQRGYFEHDAPDGETPQDRIMATGYVTGRGKATGENLAWGEGHRASPGQIVDGWMRSPGHRANILRPQFEEIGIGVEFDVPPIEDADGPGATFTTTFGGSVMLPAPTPPP